MANVKLLIYLCLVSLTLFTIVTMCNSQPITESNFDDILSSQQLSENTKRIIKSDRKVQSNNYAFRTMLCERLCDTKPEKGGALCRCDLYPMIKSMSRRTHI